MKSKSKEEHAGHDLNKLRENFLDKCRFKYGDKFTYHIEDYFTSTSKIRIVCPKHGEFTTTPVVHLSLECGCSKCRVDLALDRAKAIFLVKARLKHGSKFKYNMDTFVSMGKPMKVELIGYGSFKITPTAHLQSMTGGGKIVTRVIVQRDVFKEQYLAKARARFGDRYTYDLTDYKNNHSLITISCPIHGEFKTIALAHVIRNNKTGCFLCNLQIRRDEVADTFLKEFKANLELVKDEYKVHMEDYVDKDTSIVVEPTNGSPFRATPATLNRDIVKKITNFSTMKKGFLNRAKNRFGDRYTYHMEDYVNHHSLMRIVCPAHGVFKTSPKNFLNHPTGCKQCSIEESRKSKTRTRVYNISEEARKRRYDKFVLIAKSTYRDKFIYVDFSKSAYDNYLTPVHIECRKHGVFTTTPPKHLDNACGGCIECEFEYRTRYDDPLTSMAYFHEKATTLEEMKKLFLSKSATMYRDMYTYDMNSFVAIDKPMKAMCETHGEFTLVPCNHIYYRTNCPWCLLGRNKLT